MSARNSHVPNEEVDEPSLAFHLVRFVRLPACFLPVATIWKASVAIRGRVGSLGRLGDPFGARERADRGPTTDECSRCIQRLGANWCRTGPCFSISRDLVTPSLEGLLGLFRNQPRRCADFWLACSDGMSCGGRHMWGGRGPWTEKFSLSCVEGLYRMARASWQVQQVGQPRETLPEAGPGRLRFL